MIHWPRLTWENVAIAAIGFAVWPVVLVHVLFFETWKLQWKR